MVNGFKVVTLCGSTRFKKQFLEVQKKLTLEGNIVISVGLFGHSGDIEALDENTKSMLDRQHLAKIDLADEIFVVNPGGCIGESTRREIDYARNKGIPVVFLEDFKMDKEEYIRSLKELNRMQHELDEKKEKLRETYIQDSDMNRFQIGERVLVHMKAETLEAVVGGYEIDLGEVKLLLHKIKNDGTPSKRTLDYYPEFGHTIQKIK